MAAEWRAAVGATGGTLIDPGLLVEHFADAASLVSAADDLS